MWILHARHDPHRPPTDLRPSQPHRTGDPPRAGGQPLPLHRLPAHRQRRQNRGESGRCVIMATTIPKPETRFGKRLRGQEDPPLITGTALYPDDLKVPGMHHAIVVRSPYGAASIKTIDTKAALATPGVAAIFTGEDVKHLGAVPCAASLPGLRVPHHHLLAQDRVYYVGHPVAVVVATDRYIARDAADLVEVDYEELQAVADPEKAIADGAPAVHPEWPDNVAFTFHQEGGDTEQAFRDADVVVRQRITSQRLIPTALETRGVLAEWRAGEKSLTLHSSTQIPHLMRTLLAGPPA